MSIDKTHRIYVHRLEYAHQSLMVAIKIRSDNLTRMRMRGEENIVCTEKKIYLQIQVQLIICEIVLDSKYLIT